MKNVKTVKNYEFAPEIKIGDVFTRLDRNGKTWTATVVNRTEYFVDVEKRQPYKIWVCDGEKTYQDEADVTCERVQINKDAENKSYYIVIHEIYSKFPQYGKTYKLSN